jgi:hydroxymethylglutaryl-CoA lyase
VPEKKRIYIHEVSVRDGLQIEPEFVSTDEKVELINGLSRTGVAKIEVTSFTSPKAIPALADAEAVMARIDRAAGVQYAALVPNVRGANRALACRLDELNVVMSASRTHNLANLRMTRRRQLSCPSGDNYPGRLEAGIDFVVMEVQRAFRAAGASPCCAARRR